MKKIVILIIAGILIYLLYVRYKNTTIIQVLPSAQEIQPVTLQECEKYIRENITAISPVEEVLWWTWYVTEVTQEGENYVVSYEDGHIANNIEVSCKKKNDAIEIELIKNIGDKLFN